MSIPLDRLYHYIENIAEEISNDSIIIYRFYPHGSKILEDLLPLSPHSWAQLLTSPHLICNDQEPLNYDWYQDMPKPMDSIRLILKKYAIELPDINLRKFINIYDHCILLHSEQRSENLEKYNITITSDIHKRTKKTVIIKLCEIAKYKYKNGESIDSIAKQTRLKKDYLTKICI